MDSDLDLAPIRAQRPSAPADGGSGFGGELPTKPVLAGGAVVVGLLLLWLLMQSSGDAEDGESEDDGETTDDTEPAASGQEEPWSGSGGLMVT